MLSILLINLPKATDIWRQLSILKLIYLRFLKHFLGSGRGLFDNKGSAFIYSNNHIRPSARNQGLIQVFSPFSRENIIFLKIEITKSKVRLFNLLSRQLIFLFFSEMETESSYDYVNPINAEEHVSQQFYNNSSLSGPLFRPWNK